MTLGTFEILQRYKLTLENLRHQLEHLDLTQPHASERERLLKDGIKTYEEEVKIIYRKIGMETLYSQM